MGISNQVVCMLGDRHLGISEVVAVWALDSLVLVQQYHVVPQVFHGRAHKVTALALQVEPALDLN